MQINYLAIVEILLTEMPYYTSISSETVIWPRVLLGLDLPSLFLQQGIYHVADIIEHLHYHDVTGHLIRTEIEHLHLETGQARFSLSDNFTIIT